MELTAIEMDHDKAQAAFLEYQRAVQKRHNAEDAQIMRGYRALAKGQRLIRLPDTIKSGGTQEHTFVDRQWDGVRRGVHVTLPRLAVARADAERCWTFGVDADGAVEFRDRRELSPRNRRDRMIIAGLDAGTSDRGWTREQGDWHKPRVRAIVPIIPPALRPGRGLTAYHILFEAEWDIERPPAPVDPALIKHVGGDLWAVVAAWDLTELEQAVLAGREP
jgi:hypothetical protein